MYTVNIKTIKEKHCVYSVFIYYQQNNNNNNSQLVVSSEASDINEQKHLHRMFYVILNFHTFSFALELRTSKIV